VGEGGKNRTMKRRKKNKYKSKINNKINERKLWQIRIRKELKRKKQSKDRQT
jgi:hypothetical protein